MTRILKKRRAACRAPNILDAGDGDYYLKQPVEVTQKRPKNKKGLEQRRFTNIKLPIQAAGVLDPYPFYSQFVIEFGNLRSGVEKSELRRAIKYDVAPSYLVTVLLQNASAVLGACNDRLFLNLGILPADNYTEVEDPPYDWVDIPSITGTVRPFRFDRSGLSIVRRRWKIEDTMNFAGLYIFLNFDQNTIDPIINVNFKTGIVP